MTGAVVAASSPALANMVVAYGANAQISVSTDAGASWTSVRTALTAAGWSSSAAITAAVWMPTRKRLWIGGAAGAGAYTDDRGATWTLRAPGPANDVNCMGYIDGNDTLLVGLNTSASAGFRKSTDGGATFANEDYDAGSTLIASKIRTGFGWAIVVSTLTSTNLRATTGGAWSNVSPGLTTDLIVFTGTRWIAGNIGNLVTNASTNPTTSYTTATSAEPVSTKDLASDGAGLTLSVGDNREMKYLTTAGTTWTAAVAPSIPSTDDFISCDYSAAQGRFFALTAQGNNVNIADPSTGSWAVGAVPSGITIPAGIVCCDAAA